MKSLLEISKSISPINQDVMEKAQKIQDSLAKPPGSLGKLEDLSVQIAGITGKVYNSLTKKQLLVFASDNGVVEEGVSSAPQSVTLKQTINLTRVKTGGAVLAKNVGAKTVVCDVGVCVDIDDDKVINKKIAYGTKNISKEPAMTREDAMKALNIGYDMAKNSDADVIGIGEMGIGNTTTSSAVLSVLLDLPVEEVTGKGGGITEQAYKKKKSVIYRAIDINKPDKNDVIDTLSKVGGFDIASMCGAFLGGAASKKVMVIDGLISAVAALCAYRICPTSREYFVSSHASFEIGYIKAMDEMNLQPMLLLNMRLGEGSGCPIVFQILDLACDVINQMASFENADINDDYLEPIRQGDNFTVTQEEKWEK